MKAFLLLLSFSALSLSPLRAVIYFSEAYPNPCGTEGVNGGSAAEGREWFEITNPDGTGFKMDGYTIADNTSAATTDQRFRIGSLTIPAGGTVVFSGMALADFNSTFGTALTTVQYFEIPRTPIWSASSGTATGMSNTGWMNNGAGDNLRIFTDMAGTAELAGAYRPTPSFPGTSNGQSFFWDGVSTNWTLNATGGTPAGYESSDPGCPIYASPGVTGAAVPEPAAPAFAASALLFGSLRRRRR